MFSICPNTEQHRHWPQPQPTQLESWPGRSPDRGCIGKTKDQKDTEISAFIFHVYLLCNKCFGNAIWICYGNWLQVWQICTRTLQMVQALGNRNRVKGKPQNFCHYNLKDLIYKSAFWHTVCVCAAQRLSFHKSLWILFNIFAWHHDFFIEGMEKWLGKDSGTSDCSRVQIPLWWSEWVMHLTCPNRALGQAFQCIYTVLCVCECTYTEVSYGGFRVMETRSLCSALQLSRTTEKSLSYPIFSQNILDPIIHILNSNLLRFSSL